METTGMPTACGWLVEVPSGHPEPDSPSDLWLTVECGEVVEEGARRGLCPRHEFAMSLPEDEFDRISEAHDGRAWS